MLPSGVAAASERHRRAAQVEFLRAGWERICRERRDARSHSLLFGACLSACCEASKGTPSRGDPEPDVPYLSRITLIACPKNVGQNSGIRGRSPPQRPHTHLKLGGGMAKTSICRLGAGAGVRRCGGRGGA